MGAFVSTVERDLLACKVIDPGANRSGLRLLKHILFGLRLRPNFACVFWYRVNRWMHLRGLPGTDYVSARRFYRFANEISYYADIGPGLRLVHVVGIIIGGNATLGENVTILNDVTIGSRRRGDKRMPHIGNDVYIGSGARVVGDIYVGNGVQIGALAFINKSLPDGVTAYGIPPNVTIKQGADI